MSLNTKTYNIPVARWDRLIRVFHWTTLLLLIVTWAMVALHQTDDSDSNTFIMLHKSFGLVVFWVVLGRLFFRISRRHLSPTPVDSPLWQQKLAGLVHLGLYMCMLLMPIAGFLMTQFKGYPLSVFGLFDIPVLVAESKALSHFFHNMHTNVIWLTLLGLTGLHLVAAVYHQWIKKDRLINRML